MKQELTERAVPQTEGARHGGAPFDDELYVDSPTELHRVMEVGSSPSPADLDPTTPMEWDLAVGVLFAERTALDEPTERTERTEATCTGPLPSRVLARRRAASSPTSSSSSSSPTSSFSSSMEQPILDVSRRAVSAQGHPESAVGADAEVASEALGPAG